MKWMLAALISIIVVSYVLVIPTRVHLGWQVRWKARACSDLKRTVNELGYRILLGQSGQGELVSTCGGEKGIYYCVLIPGTSPSKKMRVGSP